MRVSKDNRLFHVDRVTADGVRRVATFISAEESHAYIEAARLAREPGVCTRRYLATRETVPLPSLRHGIKIHARRWSLSAKDRAATLAEAEWVLPELTQEAA